ncbi:MAG: DMT family transporter [Pseudomonadota bacterium]|nr:DMT family transporter [Pseudomonadota bacterium]
MNASPALRAAAMMVGAMIFFGMMSTFIRLASAQLHAFEIVFFRNFLAVLIMLPWVMRHGLGSMRTNRFGLLSLRAVLNVSAMLAGFTALTLIPLAEATALSFTAPLFATVGAALILGETVRARRIAAVLIGFAGTMIVLRPGVEAITPGALLAILNASLLAMTLLVVKVLTRTERPESVVIYMVLLQTPMALVPALFVWQWPEPLTWLWLFALASAGTAGHILFTRAMAIAEVTQVQPFEFIRLPLIAVIAYLLFDEVPTVWTWLGGAVIFAATAYITHREAVAARRPVTRQTSP